jgi:hypothetical protein
MDMRTNVSSLKKSKFNQKNPNLEVQYVHVKWGKKKSKSNQALW